jgi:hypothetical protein
MAMSSRLRSTRLLAAYRRVQAEPHSQPIFPISEEPEGTRHIGFQSIAANGRSGLLIRYQEPLATRTARFRTLLPPGASVRLTPLPGPVTATEALVDASGSITIALPPKAQYALLRYAIITDSDS